MIKYACTETCTYWAGTPDGEGGRTYTPPRYMRCRWEQKQRVIRAKDGREVVSQARVYLLEPVDLEGRLHRGSSGASNPNSVDSYELLAMEELQGLDGAVEGYVVWL